MNQSYLTSTPTTEIMIPRNPRAPKIKAFFLYRDPQPDQNIRSQERWDWSACENNGKISQENTSCVNIYGILEIGLDWWGLEKIRSSRGLPLPVWPERSSSSNKGCIWRVSPTRSGSRISTSPFPELAVKGFPEISSPKSGGNGCSGEESGASE